MKNHLAVLAVWFALVQSVFGLQYWTTWKYQTNQNPLFEGNNWSNGMPNGIQWSNCQTFGGYVTGKGGHDTFDSVAIMTNAWGADQDATAILRKASPTANFPEVEILLRATMTGHSIRCYEFLWNPDGTESCYIVRWHGDTSLGSPVGFLGLKDCGVRTLANGDVLRATCIGNPPVLTMYVNGVSIGTYTDTASTNILSGNPGIGFDSNDVNFDYSQIGFSYFYVTDGVTEHNVNHLAYSCAESNIQANLNWIVDTDTNSVPAGNAEWNMGGFLITNAIAWIGAGTNSTFITNNEPNTVYAIQWQYTGSQTSLFSGMTFSTGTNGNRTLYILGANTNTCRWRIYNNKSLFGPDFIKLDTVLGVADHNYLTFNAGGNKLAHVKDSTWNGWLEGNGAWSNATPLMGSELSFFFEDNTLVCTNPTFLASLIDAQAGGRYVARHNTITNAYFEAHGSEASYERSTHAAEIYNNFWDQNNANQYVTYWRGGVVYIFSNNINNVSGVASCLKVLDNRPNDSLFEPFGGADGRNHWDANDPGNPFATGTATGVGANTITVAGTPWTAHQWIGYIARRTSGKSVTSITRSGSTVTVSCTGHGFSNGDQVSMFGANQQEYNTTVPITVVDANTFTYGPINWAPTTPATGTIKACLKNYFEEVTENTQNTITFASSIYGSLLTMDLAINDTFELNKIVRPMDGIGVTGGSLIDSTATPSFPGAWNNQTISACYQWSNNIGNQIGVSFGITGGTITNGIHVINDAIPGGYSPYLYPHNLVQTPAPAATITTTAVLSGPSKLSGPAKIGAL